MNGKSLVWTGYWAFTLASGIEALPRLWLPEVDRVSPSPASQAASECLGDAHVPPSGSPGAPDDGARHARIKDHRRRNFETSCYWNSQAPRAVPTAVTDSLPRPHHGLPDTNTAARSLARVLAKNSSLRLRPSFFAMGQSVRRLHGGTGPACLGKTEDAERGRRHLSGRKAEAR